MDISIPAGASMVLTADGRRVTLKALATASICGLGSVGQREVTARVSVIGPSEALHLGPGRVEVTTSAGAVRLPAMVVDDGAGMVLRIGVEQPDVQRRSEVRGDLELPLQVAVPLPEDPTEQTVRLLPGRTKNVSASGLLASLSVGTGMNIAPGTRLEAQVQLPDGQSVPVTLAVIEMTHFGLRAAFVGLRHMDAERFARLVFARERERLAERRRIAELRTVRERPSRDRPVRDRPVRDRW